jgi:hypothetical protein
LHTTSPAPSLFVPPIPYPTNEATLEPTFGPLPYPTSAPTYNNSEWLRTSGEVLNVGRSKNVTGGHAAKDKENDLIIILCSVGGMCLIVALLASGLRYSARQHNKKTSPPIHIEIPELDTVSWPQLLLTEPQQMKRRSLTYPQDELGSSTPSPVGNRRRLHTAISLGEFSRGGEEYGQVTEIFVGIT